MSVYKKFTANDVAVIPFNAHKQYTFDSASAASNKVTYFDTRWTSESLDLYSSASTDTINTLKYSQLDHLYYRNFKRDLANRFGDIDYLGQQRELYQNANIISIPAGLYGHEIKPGTFSISASVFGTYNIIDDSKGNLIVSGTNLDDFETDVRVNVLNIGPVKGFKRYDLNTYNNLVEGVFDKRGESIVNPITSYSTPEVGDEFDDSYYSNIINYKNVTFSEQNAHPAINFNGSNSEIVLGNNEKYNFNLGDDFTIAFKTNISHSSDETTYILSKSTTKTIVPSPNQGAEIYTTTTSGALQPIDVSAEPQYPFEIYAIGNKIFFSRSDGNITTTVSGSSAFSTGSIKSIVCRVESSEMKIYVGGNIGETKTDATLLQTQNTANLYIGNKGGISNYLSGSISSINIYNNALSSTHCGLFTTQGYGNYPYIGNIFYSSGIATITHPYYQTVTSTPTGVGSINTLKFQGSHMIFENEYQCTVDEHEYNDTTNISARKIRSNTSQDLADFATGSLFKPYVTTVGLYNEENELLVVGKFGQPIRCSDETDTTFVLRWDT